VSENAGGVRPDLFGRTNLLLATVAGLFLVSMVVLIATGVVARYVFRTPVLGINEIVQLLSVAVVMLALPYCTEREGHVRVDILDKAIGAWGRFGGDILSRSLAIVTLSILVWRAFLKMQDALRYGDATNMLALPIWPSFGLMALGMALCVAVLILQIIHILKRGVHHE
jgi:TRAP-type C4-dicarboxylate transport system permease small subunit